ncbi:MAG: hypothetical protein CL389_00045 [Acidiferrobacteraceae bacterium]|jgi:TPP-dependent pyruvate/acetoin dehydrogenase alpha subunit|nr:hypothetical protein [Acidiferrobacteraceae bacterium]|tara:strand:+ start:5763 stop:5996 length:234 start_codon:yes stop_codon:yes gene_type:complete
MDGNEFELTKDEALDLYFKMVLTRKTEEKHEEIFREQLVPVYAHMGTGQEAVGCGISIPFPMAFLIIGSIIILLLNL